MDTIKELLEKKAKEPQKESRISKAWQADALRDMEYLGLELKPSDIGRVFKVYKNQAEGKNYKASTTRVISYLKDYPHSLDYNGMLKMFFKLVTNGFTNYRRITDLSDQQTQVMKFIIWWVRTERTPVPKKEIVKKMKSDGLKVDIINHSLSVLLAKGYIRRGWTEKMNTTVYVQLRGL